MSLSDFAAQLMATHRAKVLADRSRTWTPSLTPATDLGYECERRIVYHRVHPNDAAPIGEELASIFAEGDLHQRDVRAQLGAMGFEVLEAERNFRDERLEITGTIDGRVALPSVNGERPRRVPLEIKSTSGSPPESEAAWRASESSLLRRYYAQLQTYSLLTSEPDALALFKSKQTGEWGVVAVALDYAYAEGLCQRAERVRDAVKAWKAAESDKDAMLPPRIADRSECDGCPWRDTLCHPAEAPVDPLLVTLDEKLAAQLDRRAALDSGRKEFKKLDEGIKGRFTLTKGERFVVGARWLVEKKKFGEGQRINIRSLTNGATEP
ncbi:MAG: hypothetical protein WC876_01990 [Candidatus Thermoplasmatota archaeon]|jgi:hypothetical protein